MPRLKMFVPRLQKPLILVLLWAFSIPLCLSQTAGRVENVQLGSVLALVSGVLQTHYHGLQKVEIGTNDLISNYEEFRAHLLPYRAHFRFHLDANSLLVTMEDLESPGNGTWNRSLIPANAAEAKLIAQMVDQLNAANQQLAKSRMPPAPVSVPDPPRAPSPLPSPSPVPAPGQIANVVSLDKAKHLVFDPTPSRCAEGLCAVSKDGLWGFIDYRGNLVLNFQYPSTGNVPYFSHGVCAVGSRDPKGPTTVGFGFIDKKGNPLFGKKVFAYAHPFVDEVTTVSLFEKVDFQNVTAILDLQGHLLRYSKHGLYIDEGFHDGLIRDQVSAFHPNPYGYLNAKMEWVVPESYKQAQAFSHGLAWVASQPAGAALKWGAINAKGKVVIPFNFSKEPEPFSEGLAIVHCSDNTIGYVDASGKAAVPCQYAFAGRFVDGNAYVIERDPHNPDDTLAALIDKQGKVIIEWHKSTNNPTLRELRDDGTYHITTYQGDGNGLVDSGWNLLVPPLFENIGLFPIGDADGLAWAVYREKGGKSYQGFIDRHGNFVLLEEQSKF